TSLELIRLAGDTPGAVESVRTMMEEQVRLMVRLIDDLLDVSRITLGKIRLQRQPTPLATLVNAAAEAHREAFAVKRLSLDVDLPGEAVLLDVDPTRLVQVLSNVVHNAVKFSEEGGRVGISARMNEGENGIPPALTLAVSDSGVGISREMLPRMFDL